MMQKKKTLLIVDDHALFREGLRIVLEKDRRFEVIGEASTAEEALELVQKHLPEISVVDISLPDKSGIHLTREISRLQPEAKVIIVSMHSKIDYVLASFKAGAKGYVLKDSSPNRLLEGLQTVAAGEYFVDSSLSFEMVQSLMNSSNGDKQAADPAYSTLSQREQEMLRLFAEGMTANEIADSLSLSRKTVENHRNHIMKKLGADSTIDLIRYATKLGLVDVTLWRT